MTFESAKGKEFVVALEALAESENSPESHLKSTSPEAAGAVKKRKRKNRKNRKKTQNGQNLGDVCDEVLTENHRNEGYEGMDSDLEKVALEFGNIDKQHVPSRKKRNRKNKNHRRNSLATSEDGNAGKPPPSPPPSPIGSPGEPIMRNEVNETETPATPVTPPSTPIQGQKGRRKNKKNRNSSAEAGLEVTPSNLVTPLCTPLGSPEISGTPRTPNASPVNTESKSAQSSKKKKKKRQSAANSDAITLQEYAPASNIMIGTTGKNSGKKKKSSGRQKIETAVATPDPVPSELSVDVDRVTPGTSATAKSHGSIGNVGFSAGETLSDHHERPMRLVVFTTSNLFKFIRDVIDLTRGDKKNIQGWMVNTTILT